MPLGSEGERLSFKKITPRDSMLIHSPVSALKSMGSQHGCGQPLRFQPLLPCHGSRDVA
jgi:hypothetical protein